MKDKLRQLILESTKNYNCDYDTSSVIHNIFEAFETFKYSKRKWIDVFEQVIKSL